MKQKAEDVYWRQTLVLGISLILLILFALEINAKPM